MARKKGSMSLKDFHGGEIRSDLPLPSKPGVGSEPSLKSSFERDPSRDRFVPAYGHNNPRAPANADRTYFPDPSTLGKNYEEDERKPVGGVAKRPDSLTSFSGGTFPSHLVTERFPPSGGGYTSRLADLPGTPPPQQDSPPKDEQRPRLQLQPRSRPLEDDITADVTTTPGAQVLTIERSVFKEPESAEGEQGTGSEAGGEERPKERPKLNLKPRSQEGGAQQQEEQGRPGVFGGARPRDVVLKERGVDDAVIIGVADSPKKEAPIGKVGSPDGSRWGRAGSEPREDRYVRADAQRRPAGKDFDPQENGPTRNGWVEKPGFAEGGGFRANGGFERQGSGGFTRLGSFGDNRGVNSQWRQPKPASPPIRSALIDVTARKDPQETPLTSLQLAEAFSRSTGLGSPGQGRGPGGVSRGSPSGSPSWTGPPGRGNERPGAFGRGPGGGFSAGGRGFGPGGARFGGPGREGYRGVETGYRGPPRSQVYQDDERG